MRSIIASEMISLDGFFTGPRGDFDWPLVDEGFNQFAIEQLDSVDTILFGRVTYQGMASYWPTAVTSPSGTLKSDSGVEFAVPTSASDLSERQKLKLVSTKPLKTGVVGLFYQKSKE